MINRQHAHGPKQLPQPDPIWSFSPDTDHSNPACSNPWAEACLTPVYVNSFTVTQSFPFTYVLHAAARMLRGQIGVAVRKNKLLAEAKYFLPGPLQKRLADHSTHLIQCLCFSTSDCRQNSRQIQLWSELCPSPIAHKVGMLLCCSYL